MSTRHFLFFLLILPCCAPAQNSALTAKLLRPAGGRVAAEKYGTVEVGVQAPALDALLANFFAGRTPTLDPYDPEQVLILAEFSCKGKSELVEGFYAQDAIADERANVFTTRASAWPWRVRFAPPDTGLWECRIAVKANNASPVYAQALRFRCIDSKKHGVLRVAEDKRHLEFSDGAPFFAIGQNIAWTEEPVLRGRPGPPPMYVGGYYDVLSYLHNLGDNGGNYARIVMAHWSTDLEWGHAGQYDQGRAFVLDSIFSVAEEKGIYIHLCVDMHIGNASTSPPYNWPNHPYYKILGENSVASDMFANERTAALLKKKMRYIRNRYGYSPHLAVYELLSEIENWEGWEKNKTALADYHRSMAHFLHDSLRAPQLVSTCFATRDNKFLYELDEMQLTSLHHYSNNRTVAAWRWRQLNSRNLKQTERGMHRRFDKPCTFGEMGMTNGPGNNADADDHEYCNDVSFHNALWSTAFMGSFGTGLNWWQWKNDAYREANMKPLREFMDKVVIDPRSFPEAEMWAGDGLEVFYKSNRSRFKTAAVGWVHNQSYWWGNMPQECLDRSGKKMPLPKDDDKKVDRPAQAGKKYFVLENINPGPSRRCAVVFYDTRTGQRLGEPMQLKVSRLGKVRIPYPDAPDCAFKVTQPLVHF